MPKTKRQFMAQSKMRAIPAAEKEKRWKQHLASDGGSGQGRRRRRPTHLRGSGDYFTNAKTFLQQNTPKGLFAAGGSHLGRALSGLVSPSLSGAGEALGRHLGDRLAKIVGMGDYDLKYNSLLDPAAAKAVAHGIGFGARGSDIVISHRENLGILKVPPLAAGQTASPYQQTRYRIQPTNKQLFPWLAGVAGNFVEYEIHGLIFSFETTCSPYSASMGLGTIALATQHNANSIPYGSMKTVLNVENKASGHPAEDVVHGVECDPSMQPDGSTSHYVRRSGDQGPPNLYDFGQLTVATEGLPQAACDTSLGQLFVTYQIKFSAAELPPTTLMDGKILCVYGAFTGQPANTPPLGPSLGLVKETNLKPGIDFLTLDVGSAGNKPVQLLMPKAGPYAFPDLVDSFQNMMYWIHDDTAAVCTQHLGFRYEGFYDICICCSSTDATIDWGHKEPIVSGEGGSLAYSVGDYVFYNGTLPSLSYGMHTCWYKVACIEPGQSVSISLPEMPATAEQSYSTMMMVNRGTPWDTNTPTVSGHPVTPSIPTAPDQVEIPTIEEWRSQSILHGGRRRPTAAIARQRVARLDLGSLDEEWVEDPCTPDCTCDATSSDEPHRNPNSKGEKSVHFGPCA